MWTDTLIRYLVPALTFCAVVVVIVMANRHFRRIQRKFHDDQISEIERRAACPDCGSSLRADNNGISTEKCPVCAKA